MSTSAEPELPRPAEDEEKALQETLGYLNFSNGKPDPRFERHLNHFFSRLRPDHPWQRLQALLLSGLARLKGNVSAFQDCDQAENVIRVAFDVLEPTYQKYHSDLLFHLQPEDFHNPLFLARLFEAGLQQGGPWDETDRILAGALRDLNDFLGHRPVAVLESGQQMQPYPHERLRPFPLYIAGVGVAAGPYEELISRTLEFLKATPPDILTDAHFHLQNLDELSLDPRAHDHQHPMYKRTNYMFGEWDPHLLDNQGRYRRFVLRSIILQALEDWMRSVSSRPHDEILFEAAAVLCGTILMASTISGAGPHTYDSTVSLGTLLSKVARQRDAFYARLLESVRGTLATRLRREAEQARQPFGPVRQYLNLFVANLGSQQIQHSHLS